MDELIVLKKAIEATGEKKERNFTVTGLLVGADVDIKTFHMKFPDAPDIQGSVDDEFDIGQLHIVLGGRYKATILETMTVAYATEEEKTVHLLLNLAS